MLLLLLYVLFKCINLSNYTIPKEMSFVIFVIKVVFHLVIYFRSFILQLFIILFILFSLSTKFNVRIANLILYRNKCLYKYVLCACVCKHILVDT